MFFIIFYNNNITTPTTPHGAYVPCRRLVVGVIYLQFESKENKIIIESFSRIYLEIIEGYAKAHAWKVCIRETVSWVRIPLSPPFFNKMKLMIFNDNIMFRIMKGANMSGWEILAVLAVIYWIMQ